jgi:hypothetical protein
MSAVSIGARDLGLRAGIDAAFESNSPSGDAARDRRLDHGRDRGAYKDPRQCLMEQIARRPRTSNMRTARRQSQVVDRPANAAQTGGRHGPRLSADGLYARSLFEARP